MSIQALRERKAALHQEANKLLADKGSQTWSKEDQAKFDGLMDESDRTDAQIKAHERALKESAEANFSDATKLEPKGQKKTQQQVGIETFLRKGFNNLTPEEALAVRNTMSTTTSSEGGYTVQTLVAKEFIDLLKAYAYMRKVAKTITTENGADLSYPTTDGTSEVGELLAQNTPANTQDVSFGTRALNTFMFSSKVVTVPIALLQDSQIDVQALVFQRLRDRIGRIANMHFSGSSTLGTGTGMPFGLTNAASVGKTGTTGQTTTIIYDDLVDIVDSLDAAYLDVPVTDPQLPSAAPGWMFSQTLRRVVRKIKDTAGRPVWTPSYDEGLASGTPDMLLGYPVNINNDMPAPAANAKSLAFGNLHRYVIRDAMEVQLFRFDDSAFMTKGQVGFLGWSRHGGNLMDINSVKLYQHSAT